MVLLTQGNSMINLTILKNNLSLMRDAEKQLFSGLALYEFKSLFDGLVMANNIDFSSEYGQLLLIALQTKRKDTAMKNIVFACSSLESFINVEESNKLKFEESQKGSDSLAIDSTCVDVSRNINANEVQLQFSNVPKKLGRPRSSNALTGAQRAKKSRDKRKANKLVTVNSMLDSESSKLYNLMIEDGLDLKAIIKVAYDFTRA